MAINSYYHQGEAPRDPYAEIRVLIPECLVNKKDIDRLDAIIDRVAANSRRSNVDVARMVFRLLNYICSGA